MPRPSRSTRAYSLSLLESSALRERKNRCHVWQHQQGICLPLARHPFCRYSYTLKPGWPLTRYGLEQQAEIVRHAFLLRAGRRVPGAPDVAQYDSLLPFAGIRA